MEIPTRTDAPRVAVIGAGAAGLTAAYELSKRQIRADVFEAGPQVGGLARTISLWGQRVDLGPHRFFSTDRRVNNLWLEVAGPDFLMIDRLTRIFYNNRFFQYPIRPFDALANLGPAETLRCLASYGAQLISPAPDNGAFEDWVIRAFGRRLFEIFFKTYSEKLWGIRCSELDADFAAQRIKQFSLGEAVRSALFPKSRGKHKTLVERFAYPLNGTGAVYERMADRIRANGGRVFLNAPVEGVEMDGGRAAGVRAGGESLAYTHVVSTMPLTLLIQRISGVPESVRESASRLRFRNTILVYLHVEGTDLFPDNWLYIHSPELRAGRVTNFRNWSPKLYGDAKSTILCLEYWAYPEDELWSLPDPALIEMAKREIRSTGLIHRSPVTNGHVLRLNRCYPVYARGYKELLEPVAAWIRTIPNLLAIGRYGAFKYNNQDHSILMGILAAENIAQGANHDLWAVNTDYEVYQERAIITDTGLVDA